MPKTYQQLETDYIACCLKMARLHDLAVRAQQFTGDYIDHAETWRSRDCIVCEGQPKRSDVMNQRGQSNALLSRWARDSLKEYDRVSGGGVTEEALIPMLIASLLHLADQRQLDSVVVIQQAMKLHNWEVENV